MNNKALIIGVIAVVIIGGGIYFAKSQSATTTDQGQTQQNTMASNETAMKDDKMEASNAGAAMENKDGSSDAMMKDEAGVKTFTVEGSNFKFVPNTITVKKGDKVKVTFKNTGGFHDWRIDDLKVATKQIKSPEEETVEFTADKVGSYEYYCSVGKHRDMGMKGTLTVTE
jgi:plastocyanin